MRVTLRVLSLVSEIDIDGAYVNESTDGDLGDQSPARLSKIYIDDHIAEQLGTTGTRTGPEGRLLQQGRVPTQMDLASEGLACRAETLDRLLRLCKH